MNAVRFEYLPFLRAELQLTMLTALICSTHSPSAPLDLIILFKGDYEHRLLI